MKNYRKRVSLLITRNVGTAQQLLVFKHASAELWCGIQTPGGSIEHMEEPLVAAIREGFKETGLAETEILERYFFHCLAPSEVPDHWIHEVHGSGLDSGVDFELFWVDLPELKGLSLQFHAYANRIPPDDE